MKISRSQKGVRALLIAVVYLVTRLLSSELYDAVVEVVWPWLVMSIYITSNDTDMSIIY